MWRHQFNNSDSEEEEHGYQGDTEEEECDSYVEDHYDESEEEEVKQMEDSENDQGPIPLPWYPGPNEYEFWEHPWIGDIITLRPEERTSGYRGIPVEVYSRILHYEEPWDEGFINPIIPDEFRNADSDIEERPPIEYGEGRYVVDDEEREEETEIARAA